jgi:hypothetical protein
MLRCSALAAAPGQPSYRWVHARGGVAAVSAPRHAGPLARARKEEREPDLVLAGERCPVPRDQQPVHELEALKVRPQRLLPRLARLACTAPT